MPDFGICFLSISGYAISKKGIQFRLYSVVFACIKKTFFIKRDRNSIWLMFDIKRQPELYLLMFDINRQTSNIKYFGAVMYIPFQLAYCKQPPLFAHFE